jgi:hypothetical protein
MGMLAATLIAIFIIPVSFYMVEKLTMRLRKPATETAVAEPHAVAGD